MRRRCRCCIQVNIAAEAGKAGVAPEPRRRSWRHAVRALPRLRLRGLMCILPAGRGAAGQPRAASPPCALLLRQLNAERGAALDTLSMGMSGDFREAIVEGATLVRIGTALFGPRQRAPTLARMLPMNNLRQLRASPSSAAATWRAR